MWLTRDSGAMNGERGKKSGRITRGMNGRRRRLGRVARRCARMYEASDARLRRRERAFTFRPVCAALPPSLSRSRLSIRLFVRPFVHLPARLSVCPSVRAPALLRSEARVVASSTVRRVERNASRVHRLDGRGSSRVRASPRVGARDGRTSPSPRIDGRRPSGSRDWERRRLWLR